MRHENSGAKFGRKSGTAKLGGKASFSMEALKAGLSHHEDGQARVKVRRRKASS